MTSGPSRNDGMMFEPLDAVNMHPLLDFHQAKDGNAAVYYKVGLDSSDSGSHFSGSESCLVILQVGWVEVQDSYDFSFHEVILDRVATNLSVSTGSNMQLMAGSR